MSDGPKIADTAETIQEILIRLENRLRKRTEDMKERYEDDRSKKDFLKEYLEAAQEYFYYVKLVEISSKLFTKYGVEDLVSDLKDQPKKPPQDLN